MKRILSILFAACLTLSAAAQYHSDEFTNYTDFSVPRPAGSTKISKSDLKLTDAFLSLYPDGTPVATQEDLHMLYRYYRDDPEGRRNWAGLQATTVRIISNWDIRSTSGFGKMRYIYATSNLKTLAQVYIFTGNPLISTFIRAHLAKITSYPIQFWLHSELRGYDPKKPRGMLETSGLVKSLSFALPAVKKDMTPEEIKATEAAWYERGHIPVLNWLDKPSKGNFTAEIGCGALYSCKYFKDEAGKRKAMNALKTYVNESIESDGSYAEGYGYFTYPVNNLWTAAMVLDKDEVQEVFGTSPLRYSMNWAVYGMLLDLDASGKPGVTRFSFGDNGYMDGALRKTHRLCQICELVFQSGISAWLRERFGGRFDAESLLMASKMGSADIQVTSPEEAGLPLVKAFGSGDCYIRDSWNDEGILLGLRSGDGGSRVNYGHNRAELNSIALGAFGEYLIVTPASASYRSRLHFEYDLLTRSANTITIDDMNQKRPGNPVYKEGRWDNRKYWVKGYPHAVVTKCETLPGGGALLRSDATDVYHLEMNEAYRAIRFVPDGGFFIVHDKMDLKKKERHTFDYRLHINNRDGNAYVSGKSEMLRVQRPKADLYIAIKGDAKMKLRKLDGYMHASSRDYSEDGPGQGKPGSAIELDWQSVADGLDVCAVLYPKHPGEPAPKIKWSGNKVVVNGKSYEIPE